MSNSVDPSKKHYFEAGGQNPLWCKHCSISETAPIHFLKSEENKVSAQPPSNPASTMAPGSQRAGTFAPKSFSEVLGMYTVLFKNFVDLAMSFDDLVSIPADMDNFEQINSANLLFGKLSEGEPPVYTQWKAEIKKANHSVITRLWENFLQIEAQIVMRERILLHPMDGSGMIISWPQS